MATTAELDRRLEELVKLYLEEYEGDGYTVGTFFAFAARCLLSAPIGAPVYLHREAEAYGHCLALAADQAWRVVVTARALKKRTKRRSKRRSLQGK